jgi:hypothetical protein
MKEDPRTEQITITLEKHEYNRFVDIAKHFRRKPEDVILILANKNFSILEECKKLKTNSFNKDTVPGEEGDERNPKNEQILLGIQQDILDIKKILLANNAYMYSSASKKLDSILQKLKDLK